MVSHAGDADHGRARRGHGLEGVDDVGRAQQIDLQDRLRRTLGGGDTRGVHDGGHPARTGRLRRELVHGLTVGHVGQDTSHRVPLVAQRLHGPVELTARGVGEENGPPAAEPPRDRHSHAAGRR